MNQGSPNLVQNLVQNILLGSGILYLKNSGFSNGICHKVLISKEEKSGCLEIFS